MKPTIEPLVREAWTSMDAGFKAGDSPEKQLRRLWGFAQRILSEAATVATEANLNDDGMPGWSVLPATRTHEKAGAKQISLKIAAELLTLALNCPFGPSDTSPQRPIPQAGEEHDEVGSSDGPSGRLSERRRGT